jgi:hypothetical protein
MYDGVWLPEGIDTCHHDAQNGSETHITSHPFCTGCKATGEEPATIFRVPKMKAAGFSEML